MGIKIKEPKHEIIEETAMLLAATFYEIGRSRGCTSKYKNPRTYAKRNLEKFIPNAVEHLTSMLGRSDVPEDQKELIYEALMERANEPTLKQMIVEQPSYQVNGSNPFRKMN